MSLRKYINSVKTKYNIASDKDFAMIFTVFSLSGLFVSFSRRTIFHSVGLDHTTIFIQIIATLILMIPLYQLSTLFLGFLFGNFEFFWERQKSMGRVLKRVFVRSS